MDSWTSHQYWGKGLLVGVLSCGVNCVSFFPSSCKGDWPTIADFVAVGKSAIWTLLQNLENWLYQAHPVPYPTKERGATQRLKKKSKIKLPQ